MKTCMVYPDLNSEKGISQFTVELIKGLRKQKIPLDEITYWQGDSSSFTKKLNLIKNYGIIHIQHEYNVLGKLGLPFFWIYFYLKFFKKGKVITTMHTVLSKKEEFKEDSLFKKKIRKVFYPLANKIINFGSDKIVVYSKHFKKILVNEYGLSPAKVEVLPLAMDDSIKIPSKEKSRKKLKIKKNTLLMIGTMNPYHDYEGVIRNLKNTKKNLLIVTSTSAVNYRNTEKLNESLAKLKEEINKSPIKKRIDLRVGYISQKDWWKYFSACEMVLMPYKGGVGSGVFYDAILMKKPVLATPVPFFKTIEEDYKCVKTSSLENFEKNLNEISKSKNYKKMVLECERFIKENAMKSVSKEWKKLYESLYSSKHSL